MILAKKSPQKTENLIDKANKNLDESIDLIKEYLNLEQYKKTKFLKHSTLYLDSLIEEIIDELQSDILKKNITLHKSIPKKIIIKTNKEWLKKALLNIIHNAVKYNKENGHLFLRIEKAKNGYLLIVKDTGIGIKEKDKEKIFDKYYTNDKKDGTGIGLNFAKIVIENLGGKITFESFPQKGTIFYIYLPKISRKIKLKILISSLAVIITSSLFIIDYFYCLIPQKIKIETTNKIKIIKFQDGIIAKTKINDKFKIIAYRNLFATRFRNELILKKSDIEIATNGKKIKIITPNTSFTNLGTKFETIANKITSVSVYKGKIKDKNILVNQDEGLIVSKTIQKLPLPQKIKNININNNPIVIIKWTSKYHHFKILISKDKTFNNPPIYEYQTSKHYISPNLSDGIWYVNIKAKNNNLFSIPVISKFLSLNNYYKALYYYKHKNIKEALIFVKKSIQTINQKSPAPYYLYAKILFKLKKYKKSLQYINQYEKIGDKHKMDFLKAKIYFIMKNYKKVITTLKNPSNINQKLLLAKSFYKLHKYKQANKLLYQILEIEPNNKEALKLLKFPKELKGIINEYH